MGTKNSKQTRSTVEKHNPTETKQTNTSGSFEQEMLDVHNEYRQKHGARPLSLNSELSAIARKSAEEVAKKGKLQHSTNRTYNGSTYGENLSMKTTKACTARSVADSWYREVSKYNFSKHHGSSTGHFTQLVWKDSKELGIGKAVRGDKSYTVAVYFPAGNKKGHYAANVGR